jgi:protease IV
VLRTKDKKMSESSKSRFGGCFVWPLLFLVLGLLAGILLLNALLSSSEKSTGDFSEKSVQTGASGKIVHLDVEGVITSDDGNAMIEDLKEGLKQALDDTEVKAIVIRVDSPGGEVTASDTLYHAVKLANEKKPVVIYMDSMAASGGYYLSCGARRIVANENTWTGSIGVIMQSIAYADAAAKVGVEMRTFRSGKFKDSLGGHRALTPEDQQYLQGLVDEGYERFAKIVSEARQIPLDKLKAEIADGRVFSGAEALKFGLVDKTGYVETAYDVARELGAAPQAAVVRYQKSSSIGDLLKFRLIQAQQPQKVELALPGASSWGMKPGRCYLLPPHFFQN